MKKLFLFVILVFVLVACAGNDSATKVNKATQNAYIDNSSGNTITDIKQTGDQYEEYIDNIDGYGYEYDKKSGYSVSYIFNKKEPECLLQVYSYKKNNTIVFFKYYTSCYFGEDDRFIKSCDIEVNDDTMISKNILGLSDDCGNKEGEVVNKILNAIENKTYFDY